ncbi:MAG TPA: hypothetical protein VM365_08040 [Gemmatimonadales bacterium]|jgi:hypothetical protein|nr:hypothetical protein [Gemmatimonadales bacterium]
MTTMSPTVRTATTVGDVLATVHETWMEQVATNLAPALSDEADFWSRWAVVRFLSDQFGDRFHLECALLDELDPLLPVQVTGTLASARAGLEHTMADLMITGRRRATGLLTARLARRFIDQLALWCVELEIATGRIDTADLPPEPSRLLTSLQAAHALSQ